MQLVSGNRSQPRTEEELRDSDIVLTKTDLRTGLTVPLKSKRHHDEASKSKKVGFIIILSFFAAIVNLYFCSLKSTWTAILI